MSGICLVRAGGEGEATADRMAGKLWLPAVRGPDGIDPKKQSLNYLQTSIE